MKRARGSTGRAGRAVKKPRKHGDGDGDGDEEETEQLYDDDDFDSGSDADFASDLPRVARVRLSEPKQGSSGGKKAASATSKGNDAGQDASLKLKLSLPKQGSEGTGGGSPSDALVADLFGELDYGWLDLKKDHDQRPVWVCPDGRIFLETFSPVYKQAYDFLIAISEPQSRPPLLHEYQLTAYSLYAAVSVGLETKEILSTLERLSKTKLPENIASYVAQSTESYGKLKLVLQHNRFYVESSFPTVLQKLLQDSVIDGARLRRSLDETDQLLRQEKAPEPMTIPGGGVLDKEADQLAALVNDDEDAELARPGGSDEIVHSFEINPDDVEVVKKRCVELDYPMLEEYDFRNDSVNASVEIDLKATTSIRRYQEKSLSKMFGNGRARSGIIVLPCGAGKTLVGVTATSTVKKSTLVLCTSGVAVQQWVNQFKLWSTVKDETVTRFTAAFKEMPAEPGIVVSTYPMIAHSGRRSKASADVMNVLKQREWGLLVLDEVHVVPANMFRKVLTVTKAHCKLGLTATLVREDDKIGDLNFLIGPKLYEANWLDLQQAGHIAKVQCAEVWCEMAPEFYREYLNAEMHKKRLLFVMNPNKFQACEFLIRVHEARGDKIIIFADNLFALKEYAERLKKPFICGEVSTDERQKILHYFQHRNDVNTILISKVGDNSIDLPEANVVIQISSHFGSRRQEAQRLGRILRPKTHNDGNFNAFFYSLVSRDTQEMFYSTKRQQFLVDQGYAFKVIDDITKHDWPGVDRTKLMFRDKRSQIELLAKVLAVHQSDALDDEVDGEDLVRDIDARRAVKRAGSLKALSGATGKVYSEYSVSKRSEAQRHPLFKKFYKGSYF